MQTYELGASEFSTLRDAVYSVSMKGADFLVIKTSVPLFVVKTAASSHAVKHGNNILTLGIIFQLTIFLSFLSDANHSHLLRIDPVCQTVAIKPVLFRMFNAFSVAFLGFLWLSCYSDSFCGFPKADSESPIKGYTFSIIK